ncbi:MAG: serine/threonine protein kinase [Polyangiaceae bacterium]
MEDTGRNSAGGAGKYQAFAKLGEGGMAQVFLALARGPVGFNKLCVIKRMRSQYAKDEALVTMFIDEARLAARLSHPNVIHTYEVGENAGLYFIAMEYLDGQPLNRLLAEARKDGRAVPQGVWIRIVRDALVGLQYAHDLADYDGTPLHIVHRDVSPHNVFVTYDGQVKVVDFGIAKAAVSRTQTESGVLKGKVAYMSPEQARGEPIDARSDLFAAGIVLWEVVAGQSLYRHEYAATTLHKLLHETPPRLSTVVPGIDPDLEDLVAKSLAARPEDRFQSAHEMRQALDAWVEAHDEVVSQDDVGALVSDLFRPVRQAVQRQIQAYMSGLGAAVPEGSDTGRRPSGSGPIKWSAVEGQLPSIGESAASGSGSAVVRPRRDGEEGAAAEGRRGSVVLLLVATLVGSLVAAAVVVARVVDRQRTSPAGALGSLAPPPASAPAFAATAEPEPPGAPEPYAIPGPTVPIETPAPETSAGTPGHPSAMPPHPSRPGPTEPPSQGASASAGDPGFLSFDTYPWTRVSESGRIIGDTPLVHVALSPGPHVLTLDNPELDIHQTYAVTIKPGESISRRLGLN